MYRGRIVAPGVVSVEVMAEVGDTGKWEEVKCMSEVEVKGGVIEGDEYCEPGLVFCLERLPAETKRVRIAIQGKETVNWKGHFGPCFGYVFLRLVPLITAVTT